MSGVPPAERNLITVERDQTVVGNSDPVRVRAQVAKHLVGPAKGWLAVDDPVMPEQLAEELWEQLRLSEGLELPVELEFAGGEGLLQGLHEFAAEDSA